MFASFSEVKKAFRNLEIKNLGWFGEFSDDYPICYQKFDAIRYIFDGISMFFRYTIEKAQNTIEQHLNSFFRHTIKIASKLGFLQLYLEIISPLSVSHLCILYNLHISCIKCWNPMICFSGFGRFFSFLILVIIWHDN